ncbi:MAG: RagB/SusD family nutrient uptake outer membrane protein, partial [Prevotella sp.]|nr:RagB/SusD family nutrient uptake outer membrane protein [Prevotella sp.]
MKSKIIYIGLFMLLALTYSCSDFLEVENRNSVTDDDIWTKEATTDLFLNDMYNDLLPDANKVTQHLDQYSDNSDVGTNWMSGYANIGNAQITPENYPKGFSDVWDWEKAYRKIRKCNLFIKKVTESELSDTYKQQRISEARFLRAFIYHWLWMTYGGMPLITVPLNNEDQTIPLENPRVTAQETFDFIVTELGEIAPLLNDTETGSNAGRATKGAALTLKGWCELYHASIQRNPTNDIERWKKASATNKSVMQLGVYTLTSDFNELFMENNNSESIFARQYGPDKGNNKEMHFGPPAIGPARSGWGNFQPTQHLVDDFCMANGLPITDLVSGY